MHIPPLDKNFLCIVDSGKQTLAACISSYIVNETNYLPLFEFPTVPMPYSENWHDHSGSQRSFTNRAIQFNNFILHALECFDTNIIIILAGISEDQASYLTFLNKYNIVKIDAIEEVDFSLRSFAPHIINELSCRTSDVLLGLHYAVNTKCVLKIDDFAPSIPLPEKKSNGILIIEKVLEVSGIVAVNYSLSISSDIVIVEALHDDERNSTNSHLEDWRTGKINGYRQLEAMVQRRVGEINFSHYAFATFFTEGLPYSFILKDIIPFTYVNLNWEPDFFVFNSLSCKNQNPAISSLVFSPGFFTDDETEQVAFHLSTANSQTTKLIGSKASAFILDIYLKVYPFDILHICSHGGEVCGNFIVEQFTDRSGHVHEVEYDSVLSISHVPNSGLFRTEHQSYYRKFDGYIWGSKELVEANYSEEVYEDLIALSRKNENERTFIKIEKKNVVINSRSIKCHDDNYLGTPQNLGYSRSHPIIFNNSCWSAMTISQSFINGGAKGYIGTLWDIEESVAIDTAKKFYRELFDMTILNALVSARLDLKETPDEHVYLFWGLHFSSVSRNESERDSKIKLLERLNRTYFSLLRIEDLEIKYSRDNLIRIDWCGKMIDQLEGR